VGAGELREGPHPFRAERPRNFREVGGESTSIPWEWVSTHREKKDFQYGKYSSRVTCWEKARATSINVLRSKEKGGRKREDLPQLRSGNAKKEEVANNEISTAT